MSIAFLRQNMSYIVVYSILSLLIAQIHIAIAKNKPIEDNISETHRQTTLSHQEKLKKVILDWWKNNNFPKPLQCNNKISSSLKNTYISKMNSLEVKSFPCEVNNTSPHYTFKGTIENGYLEGKGRLLFMSEQNWLKLPNEKRKYVKEKHVCFSTTRPENNQHVREIIGIFKNGSLHGPTRITLTDHSFTIGTYKHGKAHGYQRTFNQNRSLVDAGLYEKGCKIGYHWKRLSYHLLYQDKSRVVDEIKPTLLFPFLDDGTLGDPIAGDFFTHSGALENIHKINLTNITTAKSSDCLLDAHYKLQEKENYTYSIHPRSKFPLFAYKNHSILCDIIPGNSNATSPEKLGNWFKAIDEDLIPRTVTNEKVDISMAHQVLWRLRPELEEVDTNKSVKLISDFALNQKTKIMTARILGSPVVEIVFTGGAATLDSNNQPNGINEIYVVEKYRPLIPKDNTLGWSPTKIVGKFSHGELNGYTFIKTNVSTQAWVTVKKGILHGPSIIYGISHILEPDKLAPAYHDYAQEGLGFIGYYKNSQAVGTFWVRLFGGSPGGHLHGTLDAKNGTITGQNISYIYPDMETVLLGRFEDRIMKNAQESKVLGVKCDKNGLLYVSRYKDPEPSSPRFYYEPPNNTSYGSGPPGILDPYEKKWLELRKASNPKMGQGVFIKRDAARGVIVSSYHGFIFGNHNGENELYIKNCCMNMTKTDDERRHCAKYSIGLASRDAVVNIPPEYDQLDSFLPSMGPKVNHDFRKNNSEYSYIEHPRWGATHGVRLTKNVKAGEELFTFYGYGQFDTIPDDFPWYWELKRQVEKEERFASKQVLVNPPRT